MTLQRLRVDSSDEGHPQVRDARRLAAGFLVVYGADSLVHHVHNAVCLYFCQNMPISPSPARTRVA
jgi:hypothetical protein